MQSVEAAGGGGGDLVAPPPEHCPGTGSEAAGKASACAGCPNQQICSSARPKGPDPDVARIAQNLAHVKRKIIVLSGKGGVGKSTVTAFLARGLARSGGDGADVLVGVLDIDLCGPSLPRVLGVEGEAVHASGSGWSPVFVSDNLCLMSAGFLLPGPDAALVWRGPKKNGLIKQLLRDVDWSADGDQGLDYLLVDTPPGTGDEHLSIVQFMAEAGIDGAIVVTTPQEVALLDVRKEINFCRKVGLRILGVIENMSVFVCPSCGESSSVLPSSGGGVAKLVAETGVPLLGRIPLDPVIGKACDDGQDLFEEQPNSAICTVYTQIIDAIKSQCNEN